MENERHIILDDFAMELDAVRESLHSHYMLMLDSNSKKSFAPAMFLLDRLVDDLESAMKRKEVVEVWN